MVITPTAPSILDTENTAPLIPDTEDLIPPIPDTEEISPHADALPAYISQDNLHTYPPRNDLFVGSYEPPPPYVSISNIHIYMGLIMNS